MISLEYSAKYIVVVFKETEFGKSLEIVVKEVE
jgi:hypothetical protein